MTWKSGNEGYMHKLHILSINRGLCEWKWAFLFVCEWSSSKLSWKLARVEAPHTHTHTHTHSPTSSWEKLHRASSSRYGPPLGHHLSSPTTPILQLWQPNSPTKNVHFWNPSLLASFGHFSCIGCLPCSIGHPLSSLRLDISYSKLLHHHHIPQIFNGNLGTHSPNLAKIS